MSLLKQKIAKSLEKAQTEEIDNVKIEVKHEFQPEPSQNHQPTPVLPPPSKNLKQTSSKHVKTEANLKQSLSTLETKRKSANSSKNIVKNYGRALVTFTISSLAFPYLSDLFDKDGVDVEAYRQYFKLRKENMDGISSLRALLLTEEDEEEQEVKFKKIFQYSCEVFIKYFSVNWIHHSKLGDKMAHIKSRFKILRRVQNPEYFTYLKI